MARNFTHTQYELAPNSENCKEVKGETKSILTQKGGKKYFHKNKNFKKMNQLLRILIDVPKNQKEQAINSTLFEG